MKKLYKKLTLALFGGLVLFSYALATPAETQTGTIDCKMIFNFKSWSFFYHSGKGKGTITCSDKSTANVTLRTKGGGVVDFGKSDVIKGHGKFSPVTKIDELYGSYSGTGAGIGVGKTAGGLQLSKTKDGVVNLDLSGTGLGVELGVHFGDFKIEPMKASK
jgi:hypothetical protein